MYTSTQAAVWSGTELSDWFDTDTGLKQGCPLSPALFAHFVNDLYDYIGGGFTVEEIHVRLLLYADDLVIMADKSETLQEMIDSLQKYCILWNLRVNLNKSKVMIFSQGGGKRTRQEHWTFEGEEIELVKSYKYLGITLTPKLSFKKHLEERLQLSKASINQTWANFLEKQAVPTSSKVQVYKAVSVAIMCYGSQVWGYQQYEDVEKLQRYFVKKLLGLPSSTPNYMIRLETGLPDLYIHTLSCHFQYIRKILLNMGEERLPKRLARKIIEKDIWWREAWSELEQKHDVTIDNNELTQSLATILEREITFMQNYSTERARQSIRHGLYNELHYQMDNTYLLDVYSVRKVRCIFKCRGGLLWLNASPWKSSGSPKCSMCNTEEDEDILHFMAVCPILTEFRLQAFEKRTLTKEEVIRYLNGEYWDALFLYVHQALQYRNLLIAEYNL